MAGETGEWRQRGLEGIEENGVRWLGNSCLRRSKPLPNTELYYNRMYKCRQSVGISGVEMEYSYRRNGISYISRI